MHIAAVVLLDRLTNFLGKAIGSRKADDVMARLREGPGDLGAKTFGNTGDEQQWTGHELRSLARQIQRRMLAMMAICASQPAVKASVRAAGMAAE